jgi:epoxyqueuosine reductase
MPFSPLEKERSEIIKKLALQHGFLDCGIVKAEFLPQEAERLKKWLSKEYHGEMKYMENHFDKRVNPEKLVENTKSVIVLTYNYYPPQKQNKDAYKIAKYAYGKDYHYVLKDKIRSLWTEIEQTLQINMQGRIFVDSAPVLERSLAQLAGLGWIGKNTMLISKKKGSFFFISEMFVDIPLAYDNPYKTDHCGTCTRCIDACPTDAILPGKTLNAKQCISYFTIELKDEDLSAHVNKKWEDWIFGCDICQDVCPWNRFSKPHNETEFLPDERLLKFSKTEWENLTQEEFNEIFKKSAVKRTKYKGLIRNINFLKED